MEREKKNNGAKGSKRWGSTKGMLLNHTWETLSGIFKLNLGFRAIPQFLGLISLEDKSAAATEPCSPTFDCPEYPQVFNLDISTLCQTGKVLLCQQIET